MNAAIRTLTAAAVVALALGLAPFARAQAADPEGYGDGYQAGNYGRIRFADGGASVAHADGRTEDRERSGVNAPLFPGDTIRTDGGQRVEVQLANGTIVRLDRGGEIVLQSLPNPYAKYQDNTVLALSAGILRVTSTLREKEEFRIDTRDASVYLLGDGEFRIDADARGGTLVSSVRGVAEVVGSDASVLVRGGMRAGVSAGNAPEEPRAYSAFASDGFDRWCAARDAAYRTQDQYASGADVDRDDIPASVQPYYGELAANGTWTTVADYGTVWSPSGVAAGWQPYNNGYWSYGPGGYFWVSYEPWGWAPYHYGNWQWIGGRGWCWIPGSLFAGAWVSWSWGSLYVGWAPLDYWGRPGWTGGPYSYGYYDPGCWTFVDYGHAGSTNVHRYAVPIGKVGDDLRHARVVARAPRVDPRRFGGGDGARERALRDVANDKPAHLRPINSASGTPERTLSDVQTHLMKRTPRAAVAPRGSTPGAGDASRTGGTPPRNVGASARDTHTAPAAGVPSTGREVPVARPRRILEDPRESSRPSASSGGAAMRLDARDGVRDLYQRMSRPRETREQGVPPSTNRSSKPPQAGPTRAAPQIARPSAEPQRSPSRAQAARPQAPPRSSAKSAPRAPARSTPQPKSAPQAKPKQGDKR